MASDTLASLREQLAAVTAQRDQLQAAVDAQPVQWRSLHTVTVEVVTVSELNHGGHHFAKAKRTEIQKQATLAALMAALGANGRGLLRAEGRLLVCLTRQAARLLDTDNLAGSLKHVRDAVAHWLGTDDNPRARVKWHPDQEAHKRWKLRPAVKIEILGPATAQLNLEVER